MNNKTTPSLQERVDEAQELYNEAFNGDWKTQIDYDEGICCVGSTTICSGYLIGDILKNEGVDMDERVGTANLISAAPKLALLASDLNTVLKAEQAKNKVFKTEDYHEDFGSCLFFHFNGFEEEPEVYCGTSTECDFDEEYWTYFIKMNFNPIFEQAQQHEFSDSEHDIGN